MFKVPILGTLFWDEFNFVICHPPLAAGKEEMAQQSKDAEIFDLCVFRYHSLWVPKRSILNFLASNLILF